MVMLFDLQDRRCKTKLTASLARCRVKLNLQSVSCFLSDPVRTKQHRAKRLPLYAVEEVCDALLAAGWCEGTNVTDLEDPTFCRDPLCPDTLVFSQPLRAPLQHSGLAAAHMLNTQDRSVCVAVSALRPLLFDNGDVLVVGSFSAGTVAHIAVVATARSGRVLVCGSDHTSSQVEEIQELLQEMDIKNVRILSEAFCSLNEWDASVQRLKVITVLPLCSSSALNDPVPTMHSEHGGYISTHNLHILTIFRPGSGPLRSVNQHLPIYLMVNGPIFPEDSVQSGDATDSKFFRLEPSEFTNGCFIARLSRQMDPTKVETVQDVLARAAAKGLLGGMIPEQLKTGKRGKGKESLEERRAGGVLVNERDPLAPSEHEAEKGDGEVKLCENEEGLDKEEDEGGDEEKKRGTLKGRKRKLKQRPKQVSKHHPQNQKKKEANPSHHNRRLTKSKQRRIPRLTLTLMSSAKTSSHLSPIAALAHRLSEGPLIQSQQTVSSGAPSSAGKRPSPARTAPPTPPAASKQVQRRNAQPEGDDARRKDGDKPVGPLKARGKVRTEGALKAADSVFPPIPSPSSGRSRRSLSRTSRSQRVNMSTPSSSVSLPGL
ncbi:hypothetical protein F2P81_010291 [Scophthalmus maximus]|uniref:Methyltransferase NSUN7 n=1 Tax=Scophthalmus maximus TaxID=52904 RepID=A0A6A4SVA7_SCOMX|nr:hypothetical protein F2P81_010291 [Scophthalmus maximus]